MDKLSFDRMVTNLAIFVKQSVNPMSKQCRDKASLALPYDKKLARILVDMSKNHAELEQYLSTR